MVQNIVMTREDTGRDILSTPCEKVTVEEASTIVKDLIDTVKYHEELYKCGKITNKCYGLSANQIGINKAVFVYKTLIGRWSHMINPIIVKKSKKVINSIEGCMSMDSERIFIRSKSIEICYQRLGSTRLHKATISSFTAIVIQHEMDHLNGILI